MSVETKSHSPVEIPDGIVRLLAEYTTKVQRFLERVEVKRKEMVKPGSHMSLATSPEGTSVSAQWGRLDSGLKNLVAAASQFAENGAISDLQQIEIKVRLAELESLMAAVQWMIHSAN